MVENGVTLAVARSLLAKAKLVYVGTQMFKGDLNYIETTKASIHRFFASCEADGVYEGLNVSLSGTVFYID